MLRVVVLPEHAALNSANVLFGADNEIRGVQERYDSRAHNFTKKGYI